MAFLGQTFESNELPQDNRSSYEPLPEGFYDASIASAELKSTKDGTGQYIKLRFDIMGPSHQGRVVFSNLNIKNASAKAEEIGRRQLGDIMRAIGLSRVNDTDQLIGGHVNIKLIIREARIDERTGSVYDASNEIRGYRSVSGNNLPDLNRETPKTVMPSPITNQNSSNQASPPWARKR